MNEQIDLFGGASPGGAAASDPAAEGEAEASAAAEASVKAEVSAKAEASARPSASRSRTLSRAPALPSAPGERPASLLVIDGTALLFRVYYGMPPRQAPDGREVGAVMGVCHQLLGILRRRPEVHVAMVYDAGQETFRNRIDPRYKANRGDPPPDLVPQFDLVKEVTAALGLASYALLDYEADDLMATLAARARVAGMGARLVAVDKDLCQAVSDDHPAVDLCDPKSDVITDAAGVRERLGVEPGQVVDFMALTGDSTDNIQGVRGVGPKAAQALLGAFGSLDGIYENLERIEYLGVRGAKGLAKKIAEGREDALLARRLVRLDDDAPLPLAAADLAAATRWRGPEDRAEALFAALGIRGPLTGFRRLHADRVDL
ncbi:MAG: hypothetical protein H6710_23925 [Myxococcales bacterium]|nr:hypothetical protein [Myxococcales bacterium]